VSSFISVLCNIYTTVFQVKQFIQLNAKFVWIFLFYTNLDGFSCLHKILVDFLVLHMFWVGSLCFTHVLVLHMFWVEFLVYTRFWCIFLFYMSFGWIYFLVLINFHIHVIKFFLLKNQCRVMSM
jgi:hypothetical protein